MALDQEARLSHNVPAIWTNRFVAGVIPDGLVRIAFAEGVIGEDRAFQFHSAIVMTPENAEDLARLLREQIDKWRSIR